MLSYLQTDSIKLLCEIDLKKLLPAPNERNRFNKNWGKFKLESCNDELFELKCKWRRVLNSE
jgi:hypothetical protein